MLRIEFSEYVDQASFARAFSITPEFSEPVDISWRGRTATIEFPEDLRPNTTYIVQIGTDLRDARGVALRSPISLAFSSGTQIDQGTLSGRVVHPDDGSPVAGIDVYAYRDIAADTLDALPAAPDYRTQSGADGAFTFRYLPEGTSFYVIALTDVNRSRTLDPGERFAVPPIAAMVADTSAATVDVPWISTISDTIPPEPQRVRPISSRRAGIRFSEPVHLASLDPWPVASATDTVMGMSYVNPADPREIIVMFDSLAAGSYEIRPLGAVDSSGNPVLPVVQTLELVPMADTVTVRLLGFEADTTENGYLRMGLAPVLRFSSGLEEDAVRDWLEVTDTTGAAMEYDLRTSTRTRWEVWPGAAGSMIPVVVRVERPLDPDTTYSMRFLPLPIDETGEISGVIESEVGPVVVEISGSGSQPMLRVNPDSLGRFMVRRLPAGAYHLRAYADLDGSQSWSGGAIAPYEPPEPLTWHPDSVRVRARWETALEDTLTLSLPTTLSSER